MPEPETIRTTIDSYVAHMSAGRKDDWLDLFADGATVEDPVGTPVHQGRDAIAGFWDTTQSLADEITLHPTGPVRVAAGEAAWPMQALSRLGDTKLVVDVIDVMTFDDEGRITSLRAFWDPTEIRPA